ncbi:MAG: hypothetical protein ACJ8EH_10390 [Sphingomicrobium sp.]
MSNSDDNVLQFIAASFPSVWTLELLLALKRDRRAWTREQLVSTLRASELVVAKALDALVAAGLASIEGEGAVYLPVNREVEDCVEQVEQLYRTRPNAVRRSIISAGTSSASAFADAFKIRRDGDG